MKNTTSDYLQIDVRLLRRWGYLRGVSQSGTLTWRRNGEVIASVGIRSESGRVVLSYRHSRNNGEWTKCEYPVWLDWTPCNYGGQRAWFLCPASGCGRRVATLYLGSIAACRHCYGLVYDSQNETKWDRALRRCQNIREKLGGSGSLAEDFPPKPKGMHWRIYERLAEAADDAENQCWPPWLLRAASKGT